LENPDVGNTVFSRFTGKREGTLRYYQSLAEIFANRKISMAAELERTVARIHELAGATDRVGLATAQQSG
jgi:hypothetical protein